MLNLLRLFKQCNLQFKKDFNRQKKITLLIIFFKWVAAFIFGNLNTLTSNAFFRVHEYVCVRVCVCTRACGSARILVSRILETHYVIKGFAKKRKKAF